MEEATVKIVVIYLIEELHQGLYRSSTKLKYDTRDKYFSDLFAFIYIGTIIYCGCFVIFGKVLAWIRLGGMYSRRCYSNTRLKSTYAVQLEQLQMDYVCIVKRSCNITYSHTINQSIQSSILWFVQSPFSRWWSQNCSQPVFEFLPERINKYKIITKKN